MIGLAKKFVNKTQANINTKLRRKGSVVTPEKLEHTLRVLENVEESIGDLKKEYENYFKTATAYNASSQRLLGLLQKFSQNFDVQEIAEEESDLFPVIQERLLEINNSFVSTAIPPFLSHVNLLSRTDLTKIRSIRALCEHALKAYCTAQDKVNQLSQVNITHGNPRQLSSAQEERQQALNRYEALERELEDLVVDLEAKHVFQMLTTQCVFLGAQYIQCTESLNVMKDTQQVVRDLDRRITAKQDAFESDRKVRLQERLRLDALNKMDTGFLDREEFDKTLERCEHPLDAPEDRGEGLLLKDNHVVNMSCDQPIPGALTMTNYKLCFMPYRDPSKSVTLSSPNEVLKGGHISFCLPLMCINRVENVGDGSGIVCVWAKNLQVYTLSFRHSDVDVIKFYTFLEPFLSSPVNIFAKFFEPSFDPPIKIDGWKVYNPKTEYQRMGIPNANWDVSSINENYRLCDSYPRLLVVPKSFTTQSLEKIAKFRARNRLPVLCWKEPNGKRVIVRSSQPLVGVKRSRCHEDEELIHWLGEHTNESSKRRPLNTLIVDARPKVNALGNIAKGGGFENPANYKTSECVFLNVANIHAVRESFEKLRSSFSVLPKIRPSDWEGSTVVDWCSRYAKIRSSLQRGDSGGWFKLLSYIMKGAKQIVEMIKVRKCSVLVHCSDGWDRTAQMTSLATMLMDPYYRTLEGFIVLVEKEWLSFGHRFARRIGHGKKRHDPRDTQRSPIFIQFLDTVYQLLYQFPPYFEFKPNLLLEIADAIYSCQYGTFLGNCEKDRWGYYKPLASKTPSLWTHVLHEKSKFLNPNYTHYVDVLTPEDKLTTLNIWPYYLRWDTAYHLYVTDKQNDLMRDFPESKVVFELLERHRRSASECGQGFAKSRLNHRRGGSYSSLPDNASLLRGESPEFVKRKQKPKSGYRLTPTPPTTPKPTSKQTSKPGPKIRARAGGGNVHPPPVPNVPAPTLDRAQLRRGPPSPNTKAKKKGIRSGPRAFSSPQMSDVCSVMDSSNSGESDKSRTV